MRERRTARALLIGPTDRLLLIRFEDLRPAGPHIFWATAGGGIEAGETALQAAAREVFEETGMTDLDLGPVVWTHEHVLELRGEPVLFREDYVLARAPTEIVSTANMTAEERNVARELRWWTADEIAASEEILYPAGLAVLLRPILEGALPAKPLRLGLVN